MIYLLTQMIVCLVLAAASGGAAGWLLHRARTRRDDEALRETIARQHHRLRHAETDVAMLTDDFDDLKQRSQGEIESLRGEVRRLPTLVQNLDKSQTLVRQLMQKHEAQLRELGQQNEILRERAIGHEKREAVLARTRSELESARDELAGRAGERTSPGRGVAVRAAADEGPPPAKASPDGASAGTTPDASPGSTIAIARPDPVAEGERDASGVVVAAPTLVVVSPAGPSPEPVPAGSHVGARSDSGAELAASGASFLPGNGTNGIARPAMFGADADSSLPVPFGTGRPRKTAAATPAADPVIDRPGPGASDADASDPDGPGTDTLADGDFDDDGFALDGDETTDGDEARARDDGLLDDSVELMFEPVDRQDDLKRVFGIGPVTERALNRLGITSYSQLAELETHDVERIADALQIYPGRIERDDWVGNARRQLEDVLEEL